MFSIHGFKMEPIRKSNGYTLEGIKKYKRFFLIRDKALASSDLIKKIDLKNNDETKDTKL